MPVTLDELLNAYNVTALRAMADQAGIKHKQSNGRNATKAILITLLKEKFFTSERVTNALNDLSAEARELLDTLLGQTEPLSLELLHREMQLASGKKVNIAMLQRASSTLLLNGLVFYDPVIVRGVSSTPKFGLNASSRTSPLFVPNEVRQHLSEPKKVQQKNEPSEIVPERTAQRLPHEFGRNLYLYWATLRQQPFDVIRTGYVGKRFLKLVNKALLDPDPSFDHARGEDDTVWLFTYRRLLEDLNLAQGGYSEVTIKNPDQPTMTPRFWGDSLRKQTTQMLDKLIEMRREPPEWYRNGVSIYRPQVEAGAKVILQTLRRAKPDKWYQPDILLPYLTQGNLFEVHKELSIPGRGLDYRYRYKSKEDILTELEGYVIEFIRYILTDLLYNLGIVELGYHGSEDALSCFRVTSFGRTVLSRKPTENASDGGQVVVQPNFHIFAMGPISNATLSQLDLFAERIKIDPNVFEYQITRESVYQAQQWGLTVPSIIEWLELESGQTLAQNILRTLQEWQAHHDRFVFHVGIDLLETAQPTLLTELFEQPQVAKRIERQLSPTLAVVNPAATEPLRLLLRHKEHLTAVSQLTHSATDHSVIIHADGRIEPVAAIANFLLSGRLGKFAQQDKADTWHLDSALIKQAGGTRDKVQSVLTELTALSREPLPVSLVAQIKGWGNYYGKVKAKTVTLIEFSHEDIMKELMAHPKLRKDLKPFAASNKPVAIVAPDRLAHVQAVLAELGIND